MLSWGRGRGGWVFLSLSLSRIRVDGTVGCDHGNFTMLPAMVPVHMGSRVVGSMYPGSISLFFFIQRGGGRKQAGMMMVMLIMPMVRRFEWSVFFILDYNWPGNGTTLKT